MPTPRTLLTTAAATLGLLVAAAPAGAADLAVAGQRVDDGRTGLIATPTAATPTTCRGLPADVVGEGEEYIGTEGDDVVVVVGGSAEVFGQFGDDLICVHPGEYHGSVVHGGPGDDVIVSYGGSHLLEGNGDDDVLIANGDAHDLDGGDGSDVILAAGASSAWIWGGPDGDLIQGSPGPDDIEGNGGNDVIFGWEGDDALHGDEGSDQLYGGLGDDDLDGGAHWDTCHDHAGDADGGSFSDCEVVTQTPTATDSLSFG